VWHYGNLVPGERPVLALVVLANASIAAAALNLGLTKPLVAQRLTEALDRLGGHWDIRGDGLAA
jgi:hypothetical protein